MLSVSVRKESKEECEIARNGSIPLNVLSHRRLRAVDLSLGASELVHYNLISELEVYFPDGHFSGPVLDFDHLEKVSQICPFVLEEIPDMPWSIVEMRKLMSPLVLSTLMREKSVIDTPLHCFDNRGACFELQFDGVPGDFLELKLGFSWEVIELFDTSGLWKVVAWDDDPFMLLSIKPSLVRAIESVCSRYVRKYSDRSVVRL